MKCIAPFYRWGNWGSQRISSKVMTLFGPSKCMKRNSFDTNSNCLIHTSFQTSGTRNLRVLCPRSVAVIQKPRKPLWWSITWTWHVEIDIYSHGHQSKLHSIFQVAATWTLLHRFCFFPVMVTQVIEQINHQLRKGSKSQTECMGPRARAAYGSSLQLRF